MPQRSSDIVETYLARTLGVGALAVVFLALGGVMFAFRGDSGTPLAVVLLLIGVGCLAYALYSFVKSRAVSSYKMECPMCGATNGFESAPESDVVCRQCHRTIPIEKGVVLPLKQISCGACQESNWYSDHTKILICEACGREIAIARPGGEFGATYAVQDDARPYEVVLVAFEHATDELIEALQHRLGTNRSHVRTLLTDLPSVVLTNVPRQKAELLRSELSHLGAAVEARPVGG